MNIKQNRILPLGNADINVYPMYSNAISVLNQYEKAKEWLLCNFIQLAFNGNALLFYDFNYKLCPYLQIQRISKDYLLKLKIDILDFIVQSISYGCYVYLLVHKSDISAYAYRSPEEREKDDSVHDIFIYGYDKSRKELYISDNFVNGIYSHEICTFEEFNSALENVSANNESKLGFMGTIELWQYYEKGLKNFNINRVIDSFSDYICAKATTEWNIMDCRDKYAEPKLVFGLECYNSLKERVLNTKPQYVYIQDFHLLWEHKKQIRKICLYLSEKKFINAIDFICVLDEICESSLIIRNMMIKYSISGKETIKARVISRLNDLAVIEKRVLERLIRSIKV